MANTLNTKTEFDFKIETAEVQKKGQGFLFYVLPPLLVLGVFIYCDVKTPKENTAPPATTDPPQKIEYSTTAQPVSDEELNEEDEGDAEEDVEEGDTADE